MIQSTPFCNVNCQYCYLGDRRNRSRMSEATLRRITEAFVESQARRKTLPITWHAGEPLVLPIDWYDRAHRILSEVPHPERLELCFQTNGTLLTPEWAAFFSRDPRIRIGLSIDGPDFIHDRRRKTRNGSGTHARIMRGVQFLRAAKVPFHCIAVVTDDTLDHPDEFFRFFAELKPLSLGLNPEELEGAHRQSSMFGATQEVRYRRFLRRFIDLYLKEPAFRVRELDRAESWLRLPDPETLRSAPGNSVNQAWQVISFDWEGNVHTFAPELLGVDVPGVGPHLGNIHQQSLEAIAKTERFDRLRRQIELGRERCRAECFYFSACRGGSPVNKWFEKGSFASSETSFCRLTVQASLDEYVSARLEQRGADGR